MFDILLTYDVPVSFIHFTMTPRRRSAVHAEIIAPPYRTVAVSALFIDTVKTVLTFLCIIYSPILAVS